MAISCNARNQAIEGCFLFQTSTTTEESEKPGHHVVANNGGSKKQIWRAPNTAAASQKPEDTERRPSPSAKASEVMPILKLVSSADPVENDTTCPILPRISACQAITSPRHLDQYPRLASRPISKGLRLQPLRDSVLFHFWDSVLINFWDSVLIYSGRLHSCSTRDSPCL